MTDKTTKPFTQVPEEVILHKAISPTAFRLYLNLLRYARQSGYCWPSQERLANDMGCSIRHIRTLLNQLEQKGLIFIDHRGELGESNHYYVKYSVGRSEIAEENVPESPEVKNNYQR